MAWPRCCHPYLATQKGERKPSRKRPIYKTYELQSLDSLKLGVIYPSTGPFPGLM